jgi:pimeloyl-ACP methyl ester carboxylesterase
MQTLQYGVADPLVSKLPAVGVPTLVVFGQRDPIAPARWVEEVARRLPDGRVATIPKAAHVPNYTAPQPLARVVDRFVEATPALEAAWGLPSAVSSAAGRCFPREIASHPD